MASIRETSEMPPKNNTLRFNRMKLKRMTFFSLLVKVDNPPAVVPSLIRMMNQE